MRHLLQQRQSPPGAEDPRCSSGAPTARDRTSLLMYLTYVIVMDCKDHLRPLMATLVHHIRDSRNLILSFG
jgi:hypothetical protein